MSLEPAPDPPASLTAMVCSVLAAIIYTSATLHGMEVPTPQIGAVLAAITLVNWTVFDRTPQGALLAVLCGVGAPLSEVILNAVFGLWHYPREDLPGMVSWCGPTHCLDVGITLVS